MRFAILFASMNVNLMLLRIAEASGMVVEKIDDSNALFVGYLSIILAAMDVVDFFRSRK